MLMNCADGAKCVSVCVKVYGVDLKTLSADVKGFVSMTEQCKSEKPLCSVSSYPSHRHAVIT